MADKEAHKEPHRKTDGESRRDDIKDETKEKGRQNHGRYEGGRDADQPREAQEGKDGNEKRIPPTEKNESERVPFTDPDTVGRGLEEEE